MVHTTFRSSTEAGSGSGSGTSEENGRTRTPNSVLNGFQTNMHTTRGKFSYLNNRKGKRYTHVPRTNPVGEEFDEACKKYPSTQFDGNIPDGIEIKIISDQKAEGVKKKIEVKHDELSKVKDELDAYKNVHEAQNTDDIPRGELLTIATLEKKVTRYESELESLHQDACDIEIRDYVAQTINTPIGEEVLRHNLSQSDAPDCPGMKDAQNAVKNISTQFKQRFDGDKSNNLYVQLKELLVNAKGYLTGAQLLVETFERGWAHMTEKKSNESWELCEFTYKLEMSCLNNAVYQASLPGNVDENGKLRFWYMLNDSHMQAYDALYTKCCQQLSTILNGIISNTSTAGSYMHDTLHNRVINDTSNSAPERGDLGLAIILDRWGQVDQDDLIRDRRLITDYKFTNIRISPLKGLDEMIKVYRRLQHNKGMIHYEFVMQIKTALSHAKTIPTIPFSWTTFGRWKDFADDSTKYTADKIRDELVETWVSIFDNGPHSGDSSKCRICANNNKNNKIDTQHATDDCPYKNSACPSCEKVGNHHPSNCRLKFKRKGKDATTGGETVNTTTRKGDPSWKKKKFTLKCGHCHKVGHEKDKCWKLHPELQKRDACRDCKDKDCKWWIKPYGCKSKATANMITTREEIDL